MTKVETLSRPTNLGIDPIEYEAVQTHQQFCLLLDGQSTIDDLRWEQIVVSMAKSKMRISKRWNTMCTGSGGDRFSRLYKISAVEDQNQKGDDFYNWRIDQKGFPPEEVYRAAEEMYNAIKAGMIDVSRGQEPGATENAEVETESEF